MSYLELDLFQNPRRPVMENKDTGYHWIMPTGTQWAKAQNAHEPTRSYGQEIYEAVKDYIEHSPLNYQSINVLEIGAAWGVSSLAILMADNRINLVSVDKDETVKAPAEVQAAGYSDRFHFKLMESSKFWQQNEQRFHIIYVDGSHLYNDVKNDLFEAWKVLAPGGMLFLDDIVHPNNIVADNQNGQSVYGISYASWQLIVAHKITNIMTTTRLLILRKGWENGKD